ncbi:MAG: NTP transferase domain-containing protein [Sandaracinaceae bacterium]|nr:NTP transferase domain-containing protein [Myxococcales bacterium]MCB9659872.1 NTP transferase domain-containing protein [Sandaracinaceae bacterium]
MGGQPKGLLSVPGGDEPLVLHALRAGVHAGLSAAWLVGDLAAYDAPVHVAQAAWPRYLLGRLTDDPPGVGPLGGLRALLAAASEHRFEHVVVVACDMPYVDGPLFAQLATHASAAPVLAARRGPRAPWEPMLARYRPEQVLPALDATIASGARSFQALFQQVSPERFDGPGVAAALDDWDHPSDVRR